VLLFDILIDRYPTMFLYTLVRDIGDTNALSTNITQMKTAVYLHDKKKVTVIRARVKIIDRTKRRNLPHVVQFSCTKGIHMAVVSA
jgi:hypothetical protein